MNPWALLKETFKKWWKDDASLYAASISYYTIFSIGPLITISIWILGFFFAEQAVSGEIYGFLSNLIDPAIAKLVEEFVINAAAKSMRGVWPTVVGVILTFYSASLIVVQIKEVLDKIWHRPHETNQVKLIKKYAIGLIGVLGLGGIVLISGLLNAIVALIGKNVFSIFPSTQFLIKISNSVVVFACVGILISVIFKYLPNMRLSWKAVLPGALFTTSLLFVGKILFSWYLSKQMLDTTYGAAASLVAQLVRRLREQVPMIPRMMFFI